MRKRAPRLPPGAKCEHVVKGECVPCMAPASMAHWQGFNEDAPWAFICEEHACGCQDCHVPGSAFEPTCYHHWRPHTKLEAKCTQCQKQMPWMDLLEEWGLA